MRHMRGSQMKKTIRKCRECLNFNDDEYSPYRYCNLNGIDTKEDDDCILGWEKSDNYEEIML